MKVEFITWSSQSRRSLFTKSGLKISHRFKRSKPYSSTYFGDGEGSRFCYLIFGICWLLLLFFVYRCLLFVIFHCLLLVVCCCCCCFFYYFNTIFIWILIYVCSVPIYHRSNLLYLSLVVCRFCRLPLLIICCCLLLFVVVSRFLSLTVVFSFSFFFIISHLSFIVCCFLSFVVVFLRFVVCCLLFVVCCCLLAVVCLLLFVVYHS